MGTTNFVNSQGGDALYAESNSGTDNVAAITAAQRAASGSGVALRVNSANPSAPAMDLTGAGDLVRFKNAAGTVMFKVDQSGNITTSGSVTAGTETAPAVVALTDAATVAVNAALGNDFRLTIAGNRTLGNPTNPVDGQKIVIQVTQGAGAPFTLAYGTAYEFSPGLPQPALSTAAGRTDLLGFIYNASKGTWLFAAFQGGFA